MAVIIQQTGVAAGCAAAAFCSGAALNADVDYNKDCVEGGAAGAAVTITVDASAADKACGWYEWDVPADYEWAAGDWVVRLNVTTIQSTVSWDDCYICRVSSGCVSQATIGSLLNQAISLGTGGVKTMTVAGAAQTPTAGDKVIIVLVFDNSNTCTRNVGVTPDQAIDTPFNAPAGAEVLQDLIGCGVVPFPR